MNESLIDYSQETITLQQYYEVYCLQLNKLNKSINNLNIKNKKTLKEFVPQVEKLNDYLYTLSSLIKQIESSDSSRIKKHLQMIKEIKSNASSQYINFNERFIFMMKNENQTDFSYDNLSVSSSSNNGSKKGSISEVTGVKASQVSQVNQVNQVKFPMILKNDSQKLKNKELEDVLKSINQALKLSKDMKDSLRRSDDSVNSIEANIIEVNSNLKQGNKEISLLKNKESGGYFKYFIMLGVSFVIVLILVYIIYRKVSK